MQARGVERTLPKPMGHPMQVAAFVIDLEFRGNGQETDEEVVDGWGKVLGKLVLDVEQMRTVRDQLSILQKQARLADALNEWTKVVAALWWEDYGSQTHEIQRFTSHS